MRWRPRSPADEPWEVVVADNGVGPGLASLVERYRGSVPGLRRVDARDAVGAAHARNVAVSAACGDLLAFLDADDVADRDWVRNMIRALRRAPFVASRLDRERLNPENLRGSRHFHQRDGLLSYDYPPFLPHASACGLGVRREVHEAVGGFDERMLRLQDTDYCWRIQLSGVPLAFAPEALVHMRFRPTTIGQMRQAYGYGRFNVLLYKRYRAHGMPRLRRIDGLKRVFRLGIHAGRLFTRRRPGYVFALFFALGRLDGSLRYRVWGL